ncbi:MAG: hypothetical protein V4719_15310 [Planctomycetota bacterium]
MTRYFAAANFWLAFAMLTILGRSIERSNPTLYSFFHSGQWFTPDGYTGIVIAPFALSVFFFVLTWNTRPKS